MAATSREFSICGSMGRPRRLATLLLSLWLMVPALSVETTERAGSRIQHHLGQATLPRKQLRW
jgi:hypothetical protein